MATLIHSFKLVNDFSDDTGSLTTTVNGGTALNGSSAEFNGTDSNIAVSRPLALAEQSWSVGFWMRSTAGVGFSQEIFGQWYSSNGNWPSISLRTHDGKIVVYFRGDNQNNISSFGNAVQVCDGEWHHVVLAKTATSFQLYVDGVLEQDYTPPNIVATIPSTADLYLGSYNGEILGYPSDHWFDGNLWNFQIYDDTVTLGQVQDLYAQQQTEVGLFTKYLLDENVFDTVGNNHADSNDITFSDGAAVFDGTLDVAEHETSYIQIGANNDFNLQSFSCAFWVNPTSASMSAGRNKRWLMSNYGTSGGWLLFFGSTRHITFQEFSGDGSAIRQCITDTNSGKVKLNEWRHVALIVEQSKLRLYVNGALVKEVSTPRQSDIDYTTSTAWIGRTFDNSNSGGPGDNFAGAMDDIRFYNEALDDADINTLYTNGRPASSAASPAVTYDALLGFRDPIQTYDQPSTLGGFVTMWDSGATFKSDTGRQTEWTSSSAIPEYAVSSQAIPIPGQLHKVAGFWFSRKPSGVQFDYGKQVAWANALDSNGNPTYPDTNGWNAVASPGSAVDVKTIYPDVVSGRAFLLEGNHSSTGNRKTHIYQSSIATDSSSSPLWTELNMFSAGPGQDLFYGVNVEPNNPNNPGSYEPVFAASNANNEHIFVAKELNDAPEWGPRWIFYYDGSNGWNEITLNEGVRNTVAPQNLKVPVWSSVADAWFIPNRQGIFISTDSGATWTQVDVAYDSETVELNDVAVGPTGTLVACGHYGQNETGIIVRSEDNGSTWYAAALHDEKLTSVGAGAEGHFVVGGEGGVLGYSDSDGIAWDVSDNFSSSATCCGVFYGALT